MENEYFNNANVPSPEDFWPEAKDILDKHYAAKKRRIALFCLGFTLLVVSIGLLLFNENKIETSIKVATKSYKEIKTDVVVNQTKISQEKIIAKSPTNKQIVQITKPVKLQKSQNKKTTINEGKRVEAGKIDLNETTLINEKEIRPLIQEQNVLADQHSIVQEKIIPEQNNNSMLTKSVLLPLKSISFKLILYNSELLLHEKKYPESIVPGDEYAVKKKKFNYFISAYGGLQEVGKNITTDLINKEYADIRNASENKINTQFYGLNFSIEKNGFILTSGVEYTNSGELNNYAAQSKQWIKNDEKFWDVHNKQIIRIDTVYHFGIVNYNQTIINVKDSTLLSKSDSAFVYDIDSNMVKANGKTALSYLEIPLLIAYEFKFGKCVIAPTAGISLGYLTKTRGMYINKSITSIESIDESSVISNVSLNYIVRLQLSYALKSNLMVVLSPQYKSNVSSVSPKVSGISTKYTSLGASIGLRYKL